MFAQIKVFLSQLYHAEISQKLLFSIIPSILVYGFMLNLVFFTFGLITFGILQIISFGFVWYLIFEELVLFLKRVK